MTCLTGTLAISWLGTLKCERHFTTLGLLGSCLRDCKHQERCAVCKPWRKLLLVDQRNQCRKLFRVARKHGSSASDCVLGVSFRLLLQIYLSKTQHGHSMPGVRGHGGGQVAITIILGWGLVTYCACVNTVFAEKARNMMED